MEIASRLSFLQGASDRLSSVIRNAILCQIQSPFPHSGKEWMLTPWIQGDPSLASLVPTASWLSGLGPELWMCICLFRQLLNDLYSSFSRPFFYALQMWWSRAAWVYSSSVSSSCPMWSLFSVIGTYILNLPCRCFSGHNSNIFWLALAMTQ